jgi:hypothetical protein
LPSSRWGPDLEALADVRVAFDILAVDDPSLRVNNITPAALTVSGSLLAERPDLDRSSQAALS